MQIRPAQFTNDARGAPANGAAYHIGKPNLDPTIDSNKLTVKDGLNGTTTSNPFFVNSLGQFQNLSGQRINPWVDETSYSYKIISENGGIIDEEANFTSDHIEPEGQQSSVVDQTFNNFTIVPLEDLSAYDTIYVLSLSAGWEDTVTGPDDGFYAHKDGTTGTPSTGTPAGFFDSGGEGWRQDGFQRIEDTAISSIESDISTNTAAIAALKRLPTSVVEITATGTYNPPANSSIEVISQGAGGGGNGVTVTDRAGGGGGSGGETRTFIESPDASYSVTIGSGGAIGSTLGGSGGSTLFGSVCTAKGGGGGFLGGGGVGAAEGTGDITLPGYPGGNGSNPELNGADIALGGIGGGRGGATIGNSARANSGGGGIGAQETSGGAGVANAGADGKITVIIYT